MEKPNDPTPDDRKKPGQPVTRRDFVGAVAKLSALGALSHFTLQAGKSFADGNDDWCPDGTPDEEDKCEPNNGNKDVCWEGHNDNDACPQAKPPEDECSSGEGWQDKCPPDGGVGGGDSCHGGGGTTNGHDQDTCDPDGNGDECNPKDFQFFRGHDRCK